MRSSRRRSSSASAAHAVARDAIPADEAMFDIGPDTSASYARAIAAAKTVLWNGPMGVFETPPFDAGTRAVADAMAEATSAGRDDDRRRRRFGRGGRARPGSTSEMSHVSTGGGASLEFLEGKDAAGRRRARRRR